MTKLIAIYGVFIFLSLFSAASMAAWYAEASSQSAWGWGQANTRWQAEAIAMRNCRVRTPQWDVCWITVSHRNW